MIFFFPHLINPRRVAASLQRPRPRHPRRCCVNTYVCTHVNTFIQVHYVRICTTSTLSEGAGSTHNTHTQHTHTTHTHTHTTHTHTHTPVPGIPGGGRRGPQTAVVLCIASAYLQAQCVWVCAREEANEGKSECTRSCEPESQRNGRLGTQCRAQQAKWAGWLPEPYPRARVLPKCPVEHLFTSVVAKVVAPALKGGDEGASEWFRSRPAHLRPRRHHVERGGDIRYRHMSPRAPVCAMQPCAS